MTKSMKIVLFFLLLLLVFIFASLWKARFFHQTQSYTNGHICESIHSPSGPEDFSVLNQNTILFSSFVSHHSFPPQGSKLELFDVQTKKWIQLDTKIKMWPHGIDSFELDKNLHLLGVINHHPKGDRIEFFKLNLNTKKLLHLKTIKDDRLYNLNDLAIISKDDIFISQDHGLKSKFFKVLEDVFQLGQGKLYRYHDDMLTLIYDNLNFANGLAYDPHEKKLYLAEMLNKKVYRFLVEDNIDLEYSYETDFFPDNLQFNKNTGELYITGHQKLINLLLHSYQPMSHSSPFKILKLKRNTDRMEPVYASNRFSEVAASVAYLLDNMLIIGNIFNKKILLCHR